MSENNEYFLFYDNFLRRYGLWELQDQTQSSLKRNILKHQKKGWKHVKNVLLREKRGIKMNKGGAKVIATLKEILIELQDSYPEYNNSVNKCNEKMRWIYMKKYAKPLFIVGNATVTTHELPIDNWASFNKENLLDSNMSKFMSLAK